MFYTYILYSEKYHKIYIGQTSDITTRLEFNNQLGVNTYTSKFRPWELIYFETFVTRAEAMKREKQLKTSQGRTFAWQKVKEHKESGKGD
jgi:putative endonuclease